MERGDSITGVEPLFSYKRGTKSRLSTIREKEQVKERRSDDRQVIQNLLKKKGKREGNVLVLKMWFH